MKQSIITYRRTEEYHKKCLKEISRKYYQPTIDGKENKYWTLDFSESSNDDGEISCSSLSLLGVNDFEWTSQNIGNQIIVTLQNLCVSRSLKNVLLLLTVTGHLQWIMRCWSNPHHINN